VARCLHQLQEKDKDLETMTEKLKSEISLQNSLEKSLETLKEATKSSEAGHRQTTSDLTDKIKAQGHIISELEHELSSNLEEMKRAKNRAQELESETVKQSSEYEILETELFDCKNKSSYILSEKSSLEVILTKTSEENKLMGENLGSLTKDNHDLGEALEDLTRDKDQLTKKVRELLEELESAHKNLGYLEDQIGYVVGEKDDLGNQLRSLGVENDRKKESIGQRDADAEKMKIKLKEQDSVVRGMEIT
jgi:chromosome segregation ATPase